MNNPVLKLTEWLKQQDKFVQEDIAFLMFGLNPVFGFENIPDDNGKMLEEFYSRIESFSGNAIKNTGFIVGFRAVFDYIFVRSRGSEESWEKAKEQFDSIINSDDENKPKTINQTVEKVLTEWLAKKEVWLKVCQEWNDLKRYELSDTAIEAWDKSNMLSRNGK